MLKARLCFLNGPNLQSLIKLHPVSVSLNKGQYQLSWNPSIPFFVSVYLFGENAVFVSRLGVLSITNDTRWRILCMFCVALPSKSVSHCFLWWRNISPSFGIRLFEFSLCQQTREGSHCGHRKLGETPKTRRDVVWPSAHRGVLHMLVVTHVFKAFGQNKSFCAEESQKQKSYSSCWMMCVRFWCDITQRQPRGVPQLMPPCARLMSFRRIPTVMISCKNYWHCLSILMHIYTSESLRWGESIGLVVLFAGFCQFLSVVQQGLPVGFVSQEFVVLPNFLMKPRRLHFIPTTHEPEFERMFAFAAPKSGQCPCPKHRSGGWVVATMVIWARVEFRSSGLQVLTEMSGSWHTFAKDEWQFAKKFALPHFLTHGVSL